ncbi:MAG: hypothetical protein H3C26_09310 [Rhodocyclaceae bacterium]|nr:hypothetical protein [Rhodocyclaceae bacterium]
MLILRLLAVVVVIAVIGGIVAYLFSGDRKFVQFSWRVFRYALFVALLIFALLVLERVAVIPL